MARAAEPAALLALFVACALAGGPAGLDLAIAEWAAGLRATTPGIADAVLALTHLGSAYATLGLSAAGALWLSREHRMRALILITAVLFTRLAVDGLKLLIARPRPEFGPQWAEVASLSFPSGHAANSLVAFVLLAGFLASGRARRPALAAALLLALIVGLTRILLGVHWTSDVIGGWALGAMALLAAGAADRYLATAEQ